MLETVITLKPKSEWRPHLTQEELIQQMNEALTLPGVANGWTMPIKGRIEMLSTGFRTPVGIKISGADSTRSKKSGPRLNLYCRGSKAPGRYLPSAPAAGISWILSGIGTNWPAMA